MARSSKLQPDSSVNLRSFGRRKGRRLRESSQRLVDDLLPKIVIPAKAGIHAESTLNQETWMAAFAGMTTYLEIGFGGGEHLAHIATLHPYIAMIGCEPYVNGISGLLKHIDTEKLHNIRIYTDDVRDLLATMPDACLERVYILYPDPWPKARHHKRRLIHKPLLDVLARVMKPNAELRIATDWDDYATWILEQALPHPAFTWQAEKASDWQEPWPEWIPTRYEQKARREGRPSCYLRFLRSCL